MIDLERVLNQTQFGELIGVSQQTVSGLLARGVLAEGASGGVWLLQYCAHLREIAAGRATNGDLDLATERARLAKEQADRVAMTNAVTRGEMAPVADMEAVLATVGTRVGRILDTIPGLIRRRVPGIGADVVELIAGDIAKCRNMAAAMSLASLEQDEEGADLSDGDGVALEVLDEGGAA